MEGKGSGNIRTHPHGQYCWLDIYKIYTGDHIVHYETAFPPLFPLCTREILELPWRVEDSSNSELVWGICSTTNTGLTFKHAISFLVHPIPSATSDHLIIISTAVMPKARTTLRWALYTEEKDSLCPCKLSWNRIC